MKRKPKIIAIVGPTASGKSDLAVRLAKDFNGEVVSADSRQFYKGMDVGTAKITFEEMQGVPHHFISFLEPDQNYTLYDYQKDAFEVIDEILSRGKIPILVGGTGLFVSAVIENYNLSKAGVDQDLRRELNKLPIEELVKRLLIFNPRTTIDLKNKRRVVRQLEYYMLDPDYQPGTNPCKYDVLIIQPYFERAELYRKINKRVNQMVDKGLLEEVQRLKDKYGWDVNPMTGIGYREFYQYFETQRPRDNKERLRRVIEKIKRHSRKYAKRQITWFKRYGHRVYIHEDYFRTKEKVTQFLGQ